MLGIQLLVVTNAAGGLNPAFNVGDMMIFEDHIGFPVLCGNNPLVGPNLEQLGPRFPATSTAYPRSIRALAFRTASDLGFISKVHTGVYCFVSGPQYESRAECRALRQLGGDAVGMSTVPEVVIAAHSGIPVLGVSLITNKVVHDREPSVKEEVESLLNSAVDLHSSLTSSSLALDKQSEEIKANHEEVLQASRDFAADVQLLIKTVLEQLHTVNNME
jgi:purine-nucleoside phosphorylase